MREIIDFTTRRTFKVFVLLIHSTVRHVTPRLFDDCLFRTVLFENVPLCPQPHQEEDAECVQLVHLHHAGHVHAVSSVWLPHLLR